MRSSTTTSSASHRSGAPSTCTSARYVPAARRPSAVEPDRDAAARTGGHLDELARERTLTAASRRSPAAARSSPACRPTGPSVLGCAVVDPQLGARTRRPSGDTTSRTWPVAAPVPTSTAAPARSAGPLAGRSVRRPKESAVRRSRSIHTSSSRLASPAGGAGSVPSSTGAVGVGVSRRRRRSARAARRARRRPRSPRACTSPRALALATGSSSDDHGSPPAPRRCRPSLAHRRLPDPDCTDRADRVGSRVRGPGAIGERARAMTEIEDLMGVWGAIDQTVVDNPRPPSTASCSPTSWATTSVRTATARRAGSTSSPRGRRSASASTPPSSTRSLDVALQQPGRPGTRRASAGSAPARARRRGAGLP